MAKKTLGLDDPVRDTASPLLHMCTKCGHKDYGTYETAMSWAFDGVRAPEKGEEICEPCDIKAAKALKIKEFKYPPGTEVIVYYKRALRYGKVTGAARPLTKDGWEYTVMLNPILGEEQVVSLKVTNEGVLGSL